MLSALVTPGSDTSASYPPDGRSSAVAFPRGGAPGSSSSALAQRVFTTTGRSSPAVIPGHAPCDSHPRGVRRQLGRARTRSAPAEPSLAIIGDVTQRQAVITMFWTSTPARARARIPRNPPALHRQLSDKIDIEEPLCCPITKRVFFFASSSATASPTSEAPSRRGSTTRRKPRDPPSSARRSCPCFTVKTCDAARPADDDRAHVVLGETHARRQRGERAGDERVPDENVARVATSDGTSALRRVFLDARDPPLSYTVTGAGRADVNGAYVRVGDYNGKPCAKTPKTATCGS